MMHYSLRNVNLNNRVMTDHATADNIIAEALLRILYYAPIWGLDRIYPKEINIQNALENNAFCIGIGGGLYDHFNTKDVYPNGINISACGRILAAAVNDGNIYPKMAEYLLIKGLYAVQAFECGQTWDGPHPFQVLSILLRSQMDFERIVDIASDIIEAMLTNCKLFNNSESYLILEKSLGSIDSNGILYCDDYVDELDDVVIIENELRKEQNKINFIIYPFSAKRYIVKPVKKEVGLFSDYRYNLDYEKDKVPGTEGFIDTFRGESVEACRQVCLSALRRAGALK